MPVSASVLVLPTVLSSLTNQILCDQIFHILPTQSCERYQVQHEVWIELTCLFHNSHKPCILQREEFDCNDILIVNIIALCCKMVQLPSNKICGKPLQCTYWNLVLTEQLEVPIHWCHGTFCLALYYHQTGPLCFLAGTLKTHCLQQHHAIFWRQKTRG